MLLFSTMKLTTAAAAAALALLASSASATGAPPPSKDCPYPSKEYVAGVYHHLEANDYAGFFAKVAPNVNWTVEGTQPLAGQYHSVAAFVNGTVARLSRAMATPLTTRVYNVVANECLEWSVTEFNIRSTTKQGKTFDNNYAWASQWSTAGNITAVRAYLDSELVARTIVENETPFHTYSDMRS